MFVFAVDKMLIKFAVVMVKEPREVMMTTGKSTFVQIKFECEKESKEDRGVCANLNLLSLQSGTDWQT